MVLVLSIDTKLRVGIGIDSRLRSRLGSRLRSTLRSRLGSRLGSRLSSRLRSMIEFLDACLLRLKTNFMAWNLNFTIDNEHKYNWSLTETFIISFTSAD